MINMQPFTKGDWWGYSGAENFANGSEPMLGHFTIADGEHFTCDAILDGNGLGLHILSNDGDTFAFIHFDGVYAARAICALHDGVEFAVIVAMPGAERCDGGDQDIEDEIRAN